MNKRGAGHIEIILAFLLFAAAVFFALYFFSPSNTSRLVDSSLGYAMQEVLKNSTIELKTYTVKVEANSANSISINFSSVPEGMNVAVKDYAGNPIGSMRQNNQIYLQGPFIGEKLLKITFGEDINNSAVISSSSFDSESYQIASTNSEDVISEKRIISLKEAYNVDYLGLKKKFNLPGRINFGFSLEFSNLDKITVEKETNNQEVNSDNKEIKVLRLSGEIVPATLYVKIW